MAEEQVQQEQVAEEPQGEPKPETDWKAEARKWEARAKKSAQAELELEALKQSQMTEQQKAEERAKKAEAELAAIQAEQQRMADAREVASAAGVPANLLEYCADREAMERFAKDYQAATAVVHSAAAAPSARIVSGGAQPSEGEIFANAVQGFFK